ncbi:MAG: hypothetical protein CVU39_24960 [Chloroflexi bacterium HGW-Chloroflexi-10]|nr:MAG: hypothetical protein CVU39_24960 [Chloroflexi bacterium HGW-Chloroflexi-10]
MFCNSGRRVLLTVWLRDLWQKILLEEFYCVFSIQVKLHITVLMKKELKEDGKIYWNCTMVSIQPWLTWINLMRFNRFGPHFLKMHVNRMKAPSGYTH